MASAVSTPARPCRAVGEILRAARRTKGVTIEEARAATRIRLKYLQALEGDDHAVLPSPVYVSGFLRNYAQYLGLSPEEVVDLYRRQRTRGGHPPVSVRPCQPLRNPIARSTGSPPMAALTFSCMLVLVVLLNWAYARFFPTAQQRQAGLPELAGIAMHEAPAPPASGATVAPGIAVAPTAPPAPTPTPVPAAPPHPAVLTLDVRATRATTLRVVVDGEVRFDGRLSRGGAQVWSGTSVLLRAASGDAVEVRVNGQKADRLGPTGQPAEQEWRVAL
jgi:hypothetical protein